MNFIYYVKGMNKLFIIFDRFTHAGTELNFLEFDKLLSNYNLN